MLDDGVYARVDGNGVPVGLASHGKGDAALTDSAGSDEADADHDGLIDIFDADERRQRTVDDFDGSGAVGGELSDMQVSFFMNLKIRTRSRRRPTTRAPPPRSPTDWRSTRSLRST